MIKRFFAWVLSFILVCLAIIWLGFASVPNIPGVLYMSIIIYGYYKLSMPFIERNLPEEFNNEA